MDKYGILCVCIETRNLYGDLWISMILYGCYDVVWNLLSFVWIAMFLRILRFLI